MPKESFEVLMIGSSKRFYELRHNILHDEVRTTRDSYQLVTNYIQTYPVAIKTVASLGRLDLVLVYNDLGLSPKGLGKFCKELAVALSTHPNKPAVGIDRAVFVSEAEEAFEQIFKKRDVSVMYGDIGDIFNTVMRTKVNRALN